MFRGKSSWCFLFICFWTLSCYVDSMTLGSNVCNSHFVNFDAAESVFPLPGAMFKANKSRYLLSPVFRHFNMVLFTVYIIPFTISLDSANSGLLVSYSKSQFAEIFIHSSDGNSRLLSKKTSLGIPCLANIFHVIYHYWWGIVEEFVDLKVFGENLRHCCWLLNL